MSTPVLAPSPAPAPPAPVGAAANYQQHPDELIVKKKVVAKVEPVLSAEEKVTADAAADAEFKSLKDMLPSVLFGDKPKEPKVAAAAPTKPAAVAPAAPVAPVAVVAPAEEPSKVRVTRQMDAAESARLTANEIARVLDERMPKTEVAPVIAAPVVALEEAPGHFSDPDKDNYELLKLLSDSEPAKFKDAHRKFATFVDKLAKYRSDWQRANPGQQFDPNSDDHETFYSNNQPRVSESDLSKARIRRETKSIVDERLAAQKTDYERKMAELEQRAVAPEVARTAQAAANTATNQFVADIKDNAIKAHLAKSPDALREADPVAFDVLNYHVGQLQQTVSELHTILHRPGYFNSNNPVHKNIANFIDTQEAHIQQLPAQQQMYEGKRFVSRAQFAKLQPAQRVQYWTLAEPDVAYMLTQAATAQASQALVTERKRVEDAAVKYGFVKAPAAPATQGAPAVSSTTPVKPAKPAAPSSTAGEATAPLAQRTAPEDVPVEKKLVGSLF